jgi:DNA-binding MarR family transcriptional regulator
MTSQLDLAAFLPYRLSIASNAVSDRIARHYQARFGLRIPEWRLMAVLGQGGAMSQRELVHATRMDKVTVSRASAALVDRALVTREASHSDGRSHHLTLTAAGRSLYEEIAPAALAIEARLLEGLSDAERAQLATLLDRLRDAADALI